MESKKPFYKSLTFWYNLIMFILDQATDVTAEHAHAFSSALALGNLGLRAKTKSGIALK